ncbi:phosphatase PAP2 family protein [Mucilaginibacter sp. PAMB04168]|uniref:phosphatase PAP2 family protein n=1 Tax=Mucilaginibacter sp. PAMB04168 TaxID=3138567 RepID=UPI0031F70C98
MKSIILFKTLPVIAIFILFNLRLEAQVMQEPFGRSLDDRIMIHLAENRTPERTGFYYFMSKTNIYGNLLTPAGLLIGGTISNDKAMRQNALYVASSSAISYGTILLIKRIFKRPRPFRGNFRIVPVYIAGDYSFPSGHASSSMSTATSLSMLYPKWYVIAPAFLWAGSVSYSRMYLGLHYPSDVATGTLIGAGTSVYLNTIRNRVQ